MQAEFQETPEPEKGASKNVKRASSISIPVASKQLI
jgi:hypothetical protein